MKLVKSIFLLVVLLITVVWTGNKGTSFAPDHGNSSEQDLKISPDSGWVDLFNGNDLSGWVQRGGNAKYHVEKEQIVGTTVPGTPNSFLCTEKSYSDFILKLEVKVDPGLNSGIQIRSHSKNGQVYGYQVEIDPSERAWSGGIYDEARRGWLDNLEDQPKARKAFQNGEWNKYRIKADGDTIRTWINGVPVAHLVDSVDSSGFIGLQVHSTEKLNPLQVRWRNIRIKSLKQ